VVKIEDNLTPRSWETYLKGNNTEGDCQLVTTVNAYYHLTGKIVEQESDEYQELVDLTGCRHGSAIDIRKAWEKLGIWEDQRLQTYEIVRQHEIEEDFDAIQVHLRIPERKPLPGNYRYQLQKGSFLEVSVWHKFFGCHSIAIVDYESRTDCVRLTNLKHVTSTGGWMFWEDLTPHVKLNPSKSEPRYEFRTFKRVAK